MSKKDSQLRQHLQVQELNICHGRPQQIPVFKTPVYPTNINIMWEDCQSIMNIDTFVATEIREMVELNVITIHDVESKCALYSYCTIARHAVKVKQDTGYGGRDQRHVQTYI